MFPGESELRHQLRDIFKTYELAWPIKPSTIRFATSIKNAYRDIRALLQREKKCEVLPDGTLRTSAAILEVFM